MAKPITIPNTFANATTAIPLSQLDNNYSTITSAINDANTYGNYAVDSGSVNAYAITLSNVTTTYTAGLPIQFKPANTNTGASTLNVNSQGAKNIYLNNAALTANVIQANTVVSVVYDGTQFQMVSSSGAAATGNVTYGNTTVSLGGSSSNIGNLTLQNANITSVAATFPNSYLANSSVTVGNTVISLGGTANTVTNLRVTPRVSTTTSSATPTINTDTTDIFGLTAQAVDITSFTTNLSGTPTNGQKLQIYIVGTAARAITWGASFESSTVTLPSTTVSTNRLDVGFVWNAVTSKWRCVASA
jgi:hypothetical protein